MESVSVDPAKITAFREAFLKEKADAIKNDEYDQRDIDRMNNDDDYVSCFVKSGKTEGDPVKGVQLFHDVFTYRKQMNIWDLKREDINPELLEKEIFMYKNVDNKGQKLFHFQVGKHAKGTFTDEIKKLLALLMDEFHRENAGKNCFVLIFDFTNSGLSNADLEIVKYVISCVTVYFPRIVDYILLFEMPFLLGAVWKIVQAWLSAEQKKFIKFVKKSDIKQYIDEDNLEDHMKK
ncbi:DgyrCDS4658 [Dimorphilus gyrociliatus]|uniref:DgyrCDS4658 n=1 Tax=Dimorphilus gyrociliatus TaxID=2664684 RepID=A0A7I8VJV3_9ANNE|nr:DgyrCDS4658 [Dimorphilus gyrociliatus]